YVQGATSVSSFNRYMYCRNNPVMYSDPSGNMSVGASQIRYAISNSIQIAAEKLNNNSMLEDLNCRNRYLQIGMEDINLLAACMNLTPEVANQISEPQEIDNDKSQNVTDDCDDENNCENNSGQTEDAPNKPGLISLIVRNIKAIKLLAIAYNHYQIGGGKNNPLYLNSSDIDMSDFSMKDPEFKNVKKIGDIANIDFYKKNPDSGEALVIGKIDLRYEGNNRFSFMADEYNFNIEWKNGFSQRNIATFIDDYLHNGPTYGIIPYFFGGSYPIIIKGNVYIKP
ncbi:MAG: hypothetical protein Q8880_02865, partial [Bacteroidota bacterium]|nr:hypothetical protein [Bacteroidota bacterium]